MMECVSPAEMAILYNLTSKVDEMVKRTYGTVIESKVKQVFGHWRDRGFIPSTEIFVNSAHLHEITDFLRKLGYSVEPNESRGSIRISWNKT